MGVGLRFEAVETCGRGSGADALAAGIQGMLGLREYLVELIADVLLEFAIGAFSEGAIGDQSAKALFDMGFFGRRDRAETEAFFFVVWGGRGGIK